MHACKLKLNTKDNKSVVLTAYPVAEWLRRAFSTPPLLLMFGGSNPACTTKHLGFIYLKKCLLLSSQYWKEMKIQASGWKFPLEAIKTQLQAPRGKYLWEFRYRLPDEAELIGRRKLLVTRMLLVVFVKWLVSTTKYLGRSDQYVKKTWPTALQRRRGSKKSVR